MKLQSFSALLGLFLLGMYACSSNEKAPEATAEKKEVVALDSATLQIDKIGETIDSLSNSAADALNALDEKQ